MSLFIGWAAVTDPSSFRAPPAVGFLLAAVFGLTAARLIQMRLHPLSGGDGLVALILVSLAGIGGWIAFGPGARVCTSSLSGFSPAPAQGLGCRIPFGIGAVITGTMALYCVWRSLRGRRTASASDS